VASWAERDDVGCEQVRLLRATKRRTSSVRSSHDCGGGDVLMEWAIAAGIGPPRRESWLRLRSNREHFASRSGGGKGPPRSCSACRDSATTADWSSGVPGEVDEVDQWVVEDAGPAVEVVQVCDQDQSNPVPLSVSKGASAACSVPRFQCSARNPWAGAPFSTTAEVVELRRRYRNLERVHRHSMSSRDVRHR
jgi:hypothetical protein